METAIHKVSKKRKQGEKLPFLCYYVFFLLTNEGKKMDSRHQSTLATEKKIDSFCDFIQAVNHIIDSVQDEKTAIEGIKALKDQHPQYSLKPFTEEIKDASGKRMIHPLNMAICRGKELIFKYLWEEIENMSDWENSTPPLATASICGTPDYGVNSGTRSRFLSILLQNPPLDHVASAISLTSSYPKAEEALIELIGFSIEHKLHSKDLCHALPPECTNKIIKWLPSYMKSHKDVVNKIIDIINEAIQKEGASYIKRLTTEAGEYIKKHNADLMRSTVSYVHLSPKEKIRSSDEFIQEVNRIIKNAKDERKAVVSIRALQEQYPDYTLKPFKTKIKDDSGATITHPLCIAIATHKKFIITFLLRNMDKLSGWEIPTFPLKTALHSKKSEADNDMVNDLISTLFPYSPLSHVLDAIASSLARKDQSSFEHLMYLSLTKYTQKDLSVSFPPKRMKTAIEWFPLLKESVQDKIMKIVNYNIETRESYPDELNRLYPEASELIESYNKKSTVSPKMFSRSLVLTKTQEQEIKKDHSF